MATGYSCTCNCRSDSDNLFEAFFELARPINDEDAPYILQQFPVDYNDQVGAKFFYSYSICFYLLTVFANQLY